MNPVDWPLAIQLALYLVGLAMLQWHYEHGHREPRFPAGTAPP